MIRHRGFLVLALAAILAVGLLPGSNLEAQGSKGTIKIATQSPLSGGQAALGEGIKLGTQLAIDKFKGPLEKAGFKVELVPFDDQAKPDVGVANSKNIIGKLNRGATVKVLGHQGQWAQIKYKGQDAWVHSSYLTAAAQEHEGLESQDEHEAR